MGGFKKLFNILIYFTSVWRLRYTPFSRGMEARTNNLPDCVWCDLIFPECFRKSFESSQAAFPCPVPSILWLDPLLLCHKAALPQSGRRHGLLLAGAIPPWTALRVRWNCSLSCCWAVNRNGNDKRSFVLWHPVVCCTSGGAILSVRTCNWGNDLNVKSSL